MYIIYTDQKINFIRKRCTWTFVQNVVINVFEARQPSDQSLIEIIFFFHTQIKTIVVKGIGGDGPKHGCTCAYEYHYNNIICV